MTRPVIVASAVFFAAYLAVQLGWQFRCLLSNENCIMAWSMYAGREKPQLYVQWQDGSETPVDQLEDEGRVTVLGAKIDRERFLPPYLCERLESAAAVRVERPYGGGEVIVACSSRVARTP